MRVLVCGGAGYIGSHALRALQEHGHICSVLDNLSTGHEWSVGASQLMQVDLLDSVRVHDIMKHGQFDAVMHFAARSIVSESVNDPYLYYQNNVIGTINLLQAMRHNGVRNLIFSSTAAVYGAPERIPITESHPVRPLNPYGSSKRVVEDILHEYHRAYGVNSVSLRYFNAAGAALEGDIGEAHEPETHLIPNVLRSLLSDRNTTELRIFGTDYPTRDGTCIRDYIHVTDLAEAHVLGLHYLCNRPGAYVFNLGNGVGYSVFEIIEACERVTGKRVSFQRKPRRPGDPHTLVSSCELARHELGWRQCHGSIEEIISSAWRWHKGRIEHQ